MRTFTLDELTRVLICAIGVGLLVSLFMLVWKRFLKIDVSPREGSLLAAAVVGLLAGFQFTRDYRLAAQVALIVIGGSFVLRW